MIVEVVVDVVEITEVVAVEVEITEVVAVEVEITEVAVVVEEVKKTRNNYKKKETEIRCYNRKERNTGKCRKAA
jgi:hypothetical protein